MNCKSRVSFEELLGKLNAFLARNPKLRKSERRESVLRLLYESGRHLTPDEIYVEVKAKYDSRIGVSTVYRSLILFEEAHLVNIVSISKEIKRYEINCNIHHDHLVCLHCGIIVEFQNDSIEKLQNEVAEENGFILTDHDMTLIGICSKCQTEMRKKGSIHLH